MRSPKSIALGLIVAAFVAAGCDPAPPEVPSTGTPNPAPVETVTTLAVPVTTTAKPTTTTAKPTTTTAKPTTTTAKPTTTTAKPTTTTAKPPVPVTTAPNGAFQHPGVYVSKPQLDDVKAKIAAGQEPWKSAFEKMKNSGTSARTTDRPETYRFSGTTYKPAPVARLNCEVKYSDCTQHVDDAVAAYTQALMWSYTGNDVYAKNAIAIMNAWSSTLIEFQPDGIRNDILQAAWAGEIITRAAEIIRYTYNGWAAADIARYETMLKTKYLPITLPCWTGGINWLMSCTEATIGIGVFTNDRATFNAGLAMWRKWTPAAIYMTTDGPLPVPPSATWASPSGLSRQWHRPTQYIDGLQSETLRDLGHTMMGMGAMANAAWTASIQGVDLWNEEQTRLIAGFELNARYLNEYLDEMARLGGATPPKTWAPKGWVGLPYGEGNNEQTVVWDRNWFKQGGSSIYVGWEVAYSLFSKQGVSMPQTKRMVDRTRPSGVGMQNSWETLTHAR